jgi:3-carboxy-cis,cis-muconate cycloisomerase
MSDVFWPGDHRAGQVFSARSFVEAMISVEAAWLSALASAGIAPAAVAAAAASPWIGELSVAGAVHDIARESEDGGNPVIPLVRRLREQLAGHHPEAARWLHRGLTSQDVVDTALILCSRDVLDQVERELGDQVRALAELATVHRGTVMAGRTLTQFAVPITFGLKAATWLRGILDAADQIDLARTALLGQFGGAAGTMAAATSLAEQAGLAQPDRVAQQAAADAARRLGVEAAPPWHTSRAPITRIGDALTSCCDVWGRIAQDVITLSRPEIAEVSEPRSTGRGASSTMPQKQNPVLSVLIRRTALSAPHLAAQLHLAAADTGDERPAGAWQLEWPALRDLSRRATAAGSQLTELVAGLEVDAARMRSTVDAAVPAILAERLVPRLSELTGASGVPLGPDRASTLVLSAGSADEVRAAVRAAGLTPGPVLDRWLDPADYLGTAQLTIDTVLVRAEHRLKDLADHPVEGR